MINGSGFNPSNLYDVLVNPDMGCQNLLLASAGRNLNCAVYVVCFLLYGWRWIYSLLLQNCLVSLLSCLSVNSNGHKLIECLAVETRLEDFEDKGFVAVVDFTENLGVLVSSNEQNDPSSSFIDRASVVGECRLVGSAVADGVDWKITRLWRFIFSFVL